MKGKPVSFSAFGYDNCWPKAVSYVDHILSRSISTFFAVMFVYELETEEISQTLVGTDPVSPRGSQLKNLLLHGCSSSFCPRCIIRRKIIWSCPSFENRPIFGFGATSDFLIRSWLVGNNSNCAGGQASFCIGYLSESR